MVDIHKERHMEKAEISRMINSFNAIKGYFDSTRKYMPQIAKLVTFIEDIVPLLNSIHSDLHQSTTLIPKASEKLEKVTSATEMATTEVMDIVDAVIERLSRMSASVDALEETSGDKKDAVTEQAAAIRAEIDGSQDDLFSIMNALQFQDITTQQINAIGQDIDTVHIRLNDLLKGFQEDGITLSKVKEVAFDPHAEFDFSRAANSQKMADELLKTDSSQEEPSENGEAEDLGGDDEEMILGPDGQPDISAMMKQVKPEDQE